MADQMQAQVQEVIGDPDTAHVELFIDKALLPGVEAGQELQVIPLAVPSSQGFALLLVVPLVAAPPAPTI